MHKLLKILTNSLLGGAHVRSLSDELGAVLDELRRLLARDFVLRSLEKAVVSLCDDCTQL